MADEVDFRLDLAQPPRWVMDEWRRQPPLPIREDGYKLVDESFNSLTWEHRYLDWPWKIFSVLFLGIPYLFKDLLSIESLFRLTARFDEDGTGTRVTMIGKAHPRTRAALAELYGPTLTPGSPSSSTQTLLP